ncbi:hypothetical protein OGATHE_001425 [Ogataea polymorpha]|uniref:Uncharacterized protein n=1 Tax=Ogataea polymorpha TaxID=460523 RepID=A0A9P8PSS8_9ASCO|nr:hypothetical protein OGATHE_001425 [Ogataea polymorpha]
MTIRSGSGPTNCWSSWSINFMLMSLSLSSWFLDSWDMTLVSSTMVGLPSTTLNKLISISNLSSLSSYSPSYDPV